MTFFPYKELEEREQKEQPHTHTQLFLFFFLFNDKEAKAFEINVWTKAGSLIFLIHFESY